MESKDSNMEKLKAVNTGVSQSFHANVLFRLHFR